MAWDDPVALGPAPGATQLIGPCTPSACEANESGTGTIAIQTVGTPYPVQITSGAKDSSIIRFTDWGAPVSVTALAQPRASGRLLTHRACVCGCRPEEPGAHGVPAQRRP